MLAVEGIDAFFIGPMNLPVSLGRPGETHDPEVPATIRANAWPTVIS